MATTCYEKIGEVIANDEIRLKEFIHTKVHDSCPVNESWLNASIRYGTPGSRPLDSEYVWASILEKEWEFQTLTRFKPDPYPRVVLFKQAPWWTQFSSVRTTDERKAVVWQLYYAVPAKDIYAALVPAGCEVELCYVDVKILGPKEAPSYEKEPIAPLPS